MDLRVITDQQKDQYNKIVTHVIQSWEWGEFRRSLGTPLLRYGIYKNGKLTKVFQLTLHKVPFFNKYIGYLPKGPFPDKELAQALTKIGQENRCAFIKIEPDIISSVIASEAKQSSSDQNPTKITSGPSDHRNDNHIDNSFRLSPKPLFTKFNYILDLTKSEEEILKNMHPKFRYNIKVAQKHGVVVEERDDDEAFKAHLQLYFETTKRQGYLGHNEVYHQKVWQFLKEAGMTKLLIAFFTPPGSKRKIPLTSWMMLNFKDTLYYPYGGSSDQYKNVMASNLVAWEAIKLGKKLGLKKLDLWGAAAPDVSPQDHFYGFTRFKSGLGAELVEYLGSFDLVFNQPLYQLLTKIDKFTKFKAFLLKLVGR